MSTLRRTASLDASHQPIGVIDSGLGGLSILFELHRQLPKEGTIYFADSQYAPYGLKDIAFLRQRTRDIIHALRQKHDIKLLVMACNTLTTQIIYDMRQDFADLPIVGIEPGIKPAVAQSISQVIGVLATRNTLKSPNLQKLIQDHPQTTFVLAEGKGLVEAIENMHNAHNMRRLLQVCLAPVVEQNADTIVLGCTHYPFLLPHLQQLYPHIHYIHTSKAVVDRVAQQLQQYHLAAHTGFAMHTLYTTGQTDILKAFLYHHQHEYLAAHVKAFGD